MREIKYRAWNGKEIFNIDVMAISPCQWDCPDFGKRGVSLAYQPHFNVMQFTGMNDIYEDDIVETSHHIYDGGIARMNQVCFKDYCWRLVAIGEDKTNDIPLGLYANYPESIKKIGNIYENPEMLRKDSDGN